MTGVLPGRMIPNPDELVVAWPIDAVETEIACEKLSIDPKTIFAATAERDLQRCATTITILRERGAVARAAVVLDVEVYERPAPGE